AGDVEHRRQVRARHLRHAGDQRVRAGRQVPGAGDRVRLRHRAGARDRSAEGHGQGVSPPRRSGAYRAAEIVRVDRRGRDARRARLGAGAAQERARRARSARMTERILFLTGHLARPRLEKVLAGAGFGFEWSIVDIGVKVAALMTEPIIVRRLPRPVRADRVMVPGRCRADLARLSAEFGLPFQRGPGGLKARPAWFGKGGRALDLTRHDMRIFAEIVDASALPVASILARAHAMVAAGADVIDLGCLPDTPFPHLEEAVQELMAHG